MAQPQRNDISYEAPAPAPAQSVRPSAQRTQASGDQEYRLGGQVGQMQMDLARRLAIGVADDSLAVSQEERFVRYLSVAGGYTVLLAGYAGLVCLFLR